MLHIVAPSAADGLAAAVLATHPVPRSRRVAAPPTEARGLLHVGQLAPPQRGHVGAQESVLAPVLAALGQLRLARGFVGVGEGLGGLLVPALENVADGMEGGQLQPAGLHTLSGLLARPLSITRCHKVVHRSSVTSALIAPDHTASPGVAENTVPLNIQ